MSDTKCPGRDGAGHPIEAFDNVDEAIARVNSTPYGLASGFFTNRLDPLTGQGQAHPDYVYGAHAIEVSVDTDTGEVFDRGPVAGGERKVPQRPRGPGPVVVAVAQVRRGRDRP